MLVNLKNQRVLANKLEFAHTFLTRLRGLMGRHGLPPGTGLAIRPCNSVHTCFMRFHLDVAFLDRDYKVLHVEKAMPPWRFSKVVRGAVQVVELAPGTLEATDTVPGDYLSIRQ